MGFWESLGGMIGGIGRVPIFAALSNKYVLMVLGLVAFIFFIFLAVIPAVTWLYGHVIIPILRSI